MLYEVITDLAFDQRIHQGGLADVGDAHDHHAQRFDVVVAVRSQTLAQARQPCHLAGNLARNRYRLYTRLQVVPGDPGLGRLGVGQVRLVQHFKTRAQALFSP